MGVRVRVRVRVAVSALVRRSAAFRRQPRVSLAMVVRSALEVDLESHAGDAGLVAARDVEVKAFQAQVLEFRLQLAGVGAQIKQRPDEHVAADAAEEVKIEGLHSDSCARALI